VRGRQRNDAVRKINQPGKAIEDDVGQKVERAVEKGVQTGHPAESHESVPSGDVPEWRDEERDADEPERPDAGFVRDVAKRVRAEVVGQRRPGQVDGRAKRRQKKDRLGDETDDFRAINHPFASPQPLALSPQNFFLRSRLLYMLWT